MTTVAARFPHLKAYLSSGARAPDALNFEQLLGFLYAVSSAPDVVDVSEWLRFVFVDGAPPAEDAQDAERIVIEAMDLYHAINCQVFECKVELPQECAPRPDALDNLDPESGLSQWCQGFSVGHDWLEEAWEASVREEVDEDLDWQLGGCMAVLCFFASPEMARALHAEFRTDARSFKERAQTMLELLPEALNAYADIGRSLAAGVTDEEIEDDADDARVSPYEGCACGSGRAFSVCCGASRHVH
jgi:yecA family protein